jgi:hypothetical protein
MTELFTVGFTGTRDALTDAQRSRLKLFIKNLAPEVEQFRHGGCVGADWEFHELVAELRDQNNCEIYVHPSSIYYREYWAADWEYPRNVPGHFTVLSQRPPLERNKDIVQRSDMIIACPGTQANVLRSGTWSTIRYAQELKRSGYVFLPSGQGKDLLTIST